MTDSGGHIVQGYEVQIIISKNSSFNRTNMNRMSFTLRINSRSIRINSWLPLMGAAKKKIVAYLFLERDLLASLYYHLYWQKEGRACADQALMHCCNYKNTGTANFTK